eukprot:2584823-Pyramimonas_sp.AAC.1
MHLITRTTHERACWAFARARRGSTGCDGRGGGDRARRASPERSTPNRSSTYLRIGIRKRRLQMATRAAPILSQLCTLLTAPRRAAGRRVGRDGPRGPAPNGRATCWAPQVTPAKQ